MTTQQGQDFEKVLGKVRWMDWVSSEVDQIDSPGLLFMSGLSSYLGLLLLPLPTFSLHHPGYFWVTAKWDRKRCKRRWKRLLKPRRDFSANFFSQKIKALEREMSFSLFTRPYFTFLKRFFSFCKQFNFANCEKAPLLREGKKHTKVMQILKVISGQRFLGGWSFFMQV